MAVISRLDLVSADAVFDDIMSQRLCRISDIDGDVDADAREYVMFIMCEELSKGSESDESRAFLSTFGSELGSQLLTWCRHFEGKGHIFGRGRSKFREAQQGDSDDEGNPIDRTAVSDMEGPFAVALQQALESAKGSMAAAATFINKRHEDDLEMQPTLGPGAIVKLVDISSRPHLNNLNAVVISNVSAERWKIKLPSGEEFSAKKTNMIVVQSSKTKSAAGSTTGEKGEKLRASATGALAQLDAALRPLRHPYPSKTLRRLIRAACAERGALRLIALYHGAAALSAGLCQAVQLDAAFVASYSRHRSPDALFLRGGAQCARGNFAEGLKDLSAALALPAKRWSSLKGRALAEMLIKDARRGNEPLIGRWDELPWPQAVEPCEQVGEQTRERPSERVNEHVSEQPCERPCEQPCERPCGRLGAATATVGRHLYVFGGLRTSASNAATLRALTHQLREFAAPFATPERALGDLWRFDMATKEWTLLSGPTDPLELLDPSDPSDLSDPSYPLSPSTPSKPSAPTTPPTPPPRGFGLLCHDPSGDGAGSLLLLSGRVTWSAHRDLAPNPGPDSYPYLNP